jgi:predicted SprT family Zn-dependent metalloprotease
LIAKEKTKMDYVNGLNTRTWYFENLENDNAEYTCKECGEFYTELELATKHRKDEPCLNCGSYDYRSVAF